ncbi:glycoside hydrolase family 3 C-terminal domain-containing protein [Oceanobacillus sojae]|uniref:glycoside hydrolase family 3 C-terminal domain-containing protein n=1 Tax=Oceanobacillus sojae TaxID=582851 RepID=UPI00362B931D
MSAFEIAVKEGQPATVMSAYNKINGTHCSDNKELLTDILRDEWGFKGLVVTDWGGMNNRIKGFRAGCNLVMPGGAAYMEKETLKAVKVGEISEALIDASAERVLAMIINANGVLEEEHSYDVNEHHSLARIAAEQSAVLLKNEHEILPLRTDDKIGIIGAMAKEIRYQGAGSSHINPTRLVNVTDVLPTVPFKAGCNREGDATEEQLDQAIELAKQVEIPIVFAGLTDRYESEGFDRENMKMPEGHNRMINAVAEVNPNTVVVLMNGSVIEVPWINKVKAVLYMALPGQAGGEAIVNLLYGKAVPSGKLAETWPIAYEDCVSSSYYNKKDAHYREGIYVGYRYYDKAELDVRFPFGYGLSYTNFQYSNLEVEVISEKDNQYKVTLDVTNTGRYEGAEIVQLYVAPPEDAVYRPVRELKGFTKLFLKPGETKQALIHLDKRSFSIWHRDWKVAKGTYQIQLGRNSRDILLETEFPLEGEEMRLPVEYQNSWYEKPTRILTHQEWEKFLGRLVIEKPLKKGEFTMANTVNEMKDYSLIMKIMYKAVEKTVAKGFEGKVDYNDPAFRMVMASSADSSLTAMKISGAMRNYVLEGLLEMANGHYLKGIKYMIKR